MTNESAVAFQTSSRIHIALPVGHLERSIAFYRVLFGQEPTKIRPQYAKFEVAEPPVNLALNAVGGATGPNHTVSHFGIQVKSTAAVADATRRLQAAGFDTEVEPNVTCCYAVQDKVWASDPDGNRWEVYVVLDNEAPSHHATAGDACCPAIPDIMQAVQRGDLTTAIANLEKAGGMAACSCLAKPAT